MKYKIFIGILLFFSIYIHNTIAEETKNEYFNINIDLQTIEKGYTVEAFDELKLSLVPGILNESTDVEIVKLNEDIPSPWNLDRISNIYQFEFKNKQAYDNHKPYYIQFSYLEENDRYKEVFFYDKNYNTWRQLPTRDYPKEKFVRSLIHLPFARIAVFSYPEKMTVGKASWYAYKGGDYAASPDYPKGSELRVYNLDNDKFVDVTINDYGPDRSIHPDRVIDLDKIAFSKIASLGSGIINVHIEPLAIASENGKVLGVSVSGATDEPVITSKAAIVMDGDNGDVLWGKNSTTTLPLASLTKMVAIKVFLDTRPTLNKVVEYKVQDENYCYEYVENKWEVARLKVSDGETMTIEDLVYSSLVGSANNAIESLVRVSGLSRPDFIKLMNDTVRKWGAKNTIFYEPTGLSPKNHTTALDYANITRKVLVNPIIQKASTMQKYEFSTINTDDFHRLTNTNHLIRQNKYNIIGSKTGFLYESLYCLMTSVDDSKGNVIVVTLGAKDKTTSLAETEELIKYGIRNIK